MKRGVTALIATGLWMTAIPDAVATFDIRSSPESQLDFSLTIQQNSMSLQNVDTQLDTDVLAIGFQFIDIPPNLPIQIGLGGGYAFVDQQVVAGLNNVNNNASMGGLYFSLLARSQLFAAGAWDSQAIFTYDYLRVGKSGETQQSRLYWNHFTAELDLRYFLTHYLSLKMGVIYGQLNAKLTGSGEFNVNEALNTDSHVAGIACLNYHIADDQKVAISFQQGYYNRVAIQFQRTFY
jgi:hypothetical protein